MRARPEDGLSLASTLASIVIVLVVGAIALSTTLGGTKSTAPPSPSAPGAPATTTSAAPALGSVPAMAARATCVTDLGAIETAVATYEAAHGSPPPAGTAWATAPGGPLSGESWPSGGAYFTIVWSGSAVVVVPLRGPHAHATGLAPSSACESL